MSVDPAGALTGLDGLETGEGEEGGGVPGVPTARPGSVRLRLAPDASERIRHEIARAGGREVCFLAELGPDRTVVTPRAVARGNHAAVIAAARDEPQGGIMIHNHPSGLLEPSPADLAVAARLWELGLGTAITDNEAGGLYVVVEPPAKRVRTPLDPQALEELVGPDGPLAARHPRYEDRRGQRAMLRGVAERYNEGGVLLVEAGTGTGKSLAYLLPAVEWARTNEERTVVSTATINLQEQLAGKDLPLVKHLVEADSAREAGDESPGDEVSWALVKGRGNYISIRRLGLAAAGAPDLFEDDRSGELDGLREWIRTTDDGSLADLPNPPSADVWDEVRSDPDICLRTRCPHFQECFYQRSRRRAASARILVVNHHLLFTDMAVRRATQNWSQAAVLPPYRHVILDEAHNVEDAATSHLGVEVTRAGMYRMLARLDRRGKGVLAAVQESLGGAEGAPREMRRRIEEKVRPAVDGARARLEAFLEAVEPLVLGGAGGEGEAVRIANGPVPGEADPLHGDDGLPMAADVVGLGAPGAGAARSGAAAHRGAGTPRSAGPGRENVIDEPVGDPRIREALRSLLGAYQRLERELAQLRGRVEASEELEERIGARLLDLRSGERRVGAAQVALKLVLEPGEQAERYVRWLEVRGRAKRRNLVLAAAPIELGPELRETLWSKSDTVVLSSATLTTRRRFDFVRSRLGLDPDGLAEMEDPPEVEERLVPSPFDFAGQTVLGVPTDLPGAGRGAAFQTATADVVEALATETGGGIFALFTSYRALRQVAAELRDRGVPERFPLFVHGEDDRARLLRGFVEHGDGILLGTSSFWEGVDVPGDPLRGLVIQKLPFRVPSDPVVAARVEALEKKGGNAFWNYMLPMAALRLKQGFGRLIRARTDRGAVLLLDDRILTKRYGRYLRDSLPAAPMAKGRFDEVMGRVRAFYREG